ncbi:MAG TPA: PIN domain-containing protein [Thermodesulfobacteriota bacterium]|nr:PIN domain-containing protein [Thermodesulfobacteriota bacterium]
MKLSEIKTGETIFIDSNIFIYHFTGVSEESSLFLRRCEEGEITGFTGINVIIEVLHRLMMIEAVTKGFVQPGDVAKKLIDYETNALSIIDMGIEVVSLSEDIIKAGSQFRRKYGLLVNDSLTAAMMDMERIINLATLDKDFTRTKEINVYSPEDVA